MDPYLLRELGDRAARLHVRDRLPMSEAVARTVRESSRGFNNHHVQRVVEYANRRAFRDLRQPGPGEIGKLVDFPDGPALAERVLTLIRPGGTGTEDKMDATEGRSAAPPAARARAPAGGQVKVAADSEDALERYLQLREAEGRCRQEVSVLETKQAAVLGELCKHAAYALRSGCHLGDIVALVSTGAPGRPDMVKVAMDVVRSVVCQRLGLVGDIGRESLEKLSSGARPNPRHPLAAKTAEFVPVADALETAEHTVAVLARDREQLRALLRAGG